METCSYAPLCSYAPSSIKAMTKFDRLPRTHKHETSWSILENFKIYTSDLFTVKASIKEKNISHRAFCSMILGLLTDRLSYRIFCKSFSLCVVSSTFYDGSGMNLNPLWFQNNHEFVIQYVSYIFA